MKRTLLCLLLFLPQCLLAAPIASLDRSVVALGESVRLTLQFDEDMTPDLAGLKQDFDILNQSKRSQTTITSAGLSKKVVWLIDMMPKRQGDVMIPAVMFGNQYTNPLKLQVLSASSSLHRQADEVRLLVSIEPVDVYVQGQVLLTVKLLSAVNLSQVVMAEPSISEAIIKKLGQAKQYEVVRSGQRYVVLEQKYALFPQQSGVMSIPALQLDARKTTGQGMFRATGSAVRVFSEALEVEVFAAPNTWKNTQAWLPASQVTMREIWNDGQSNTFKVGEPFTRTIEIKAQGLMAEQLPKLFTTSNMQGFKQYPDQPELTTDLFMDGVVGLRREKVALMPLQAGEMTLPGMTVAWWNTDTKSVQIVQIPDRVMTVLPADTQMISPSTQSPTLATPRLPTIEGTYQSEAADEARLWWQMLTLFFALGWLVTAWRWYWVSRAKVRKYGEAFLQEQNGLGKMKDKVMLEKVKQACQAGDAHQAAKLLPLWGAKAFHDENIQSIAQLQGKSSELDVALIDLNVYLYAQHAQATWSGDALYAVITSLVVEKVPQATKQVGLKTLYAPRDIAAP